MDGDFKNDTDDNRTFIQLQEYGSGGAINTVKLVLMPILVISGFTGNSLSLVVFTATPMRNFSCSTFLAALAVVDNLFLVNILCIWLDLNFQIGIMTTNVACQAVVFASYTASFMSIWFVVSLTVERYIAVCAPFYASRYCNKSREKIVIVVIAVCAVLIYNFALWTPSVFVQHGQVVCMPKKEFFNFTSIMVIVDTFVTGLIPLVIMIFTSVRIIVKIYQYEIRRNRMANLTTSTNKSSTRPDAPAAFSQYQRKITRLLMLISIGFLLFILPGHALRFRVLFANLFTIQISHSADIRVLHESFQMLYYVTFCMNFYLYAVSGKFFRRYLYSLFCKNKQRTYQYTSVCMTNQKTPPK